MSQLRPVVATKRPATVEAWRWDGSPQSTAAIIAWVKTAEPKGQRAYLHPNDNVLVLGDGFDLVKPGDWIIRDKFNEFFPLPHDVYLTVYESPIPL